MVVTGPIDDVIAMWCGLEVDRHALWERNRELSGYDLYGARESPVPGP